MKYILLLLFFIGIPCFSQEKNTPIKVDSITYYLELSNFHKNNYTYNKALEFGKKAVNYATRNNLEKGLADTYLAIGGIYYQLKKTDDAIENFIRSLAIYNNLKPSSNIAFCYYNLGLCYLDKNSFAIAENYFDKAISIYEQIQIPDAIELINLQKGIIYKKKGNINLATALFKNIISKNNIDNLFETKAEAYYQLAEINERNNPKKAIDYLEKANALTSNNNISQKLKIIRKISTLYNKTNSVNQSFYYLKRYVHLKDSLSAINNDSIGEAAFERYIANEQLKTIEKMDKENKEQEKSIKFSKLISILSIALISILSLLSLSLYKNNIIRKKTNQLLKEKNLELEVQKERAERASKARSEFLSTVSHELRTPLNAINGITHILLEDKPKESQLTYLNSLKFSGNYLSTFINDILEINRVESNALEVEHINFNIRELFQNIMDSFVEIANNNNVICRLNIEETVPSFLIGDPTKLSQILINLINNSLKFTKDGDVWINVFQTGKDGNCVDLHFEIIDTGIGILKEKQETIFDSFTQGSVEINRKYGGTGLGLSIVRRLVEILGGKIHLESELDKGAKFYFDLAFPIGEEIKVEKKTGLGYDEQWLIDKKILLVEDNKINQMITKKMLERKQMVCTIIENGEDAIEHLEKHRNEYDLVLMDVHLPGINGTIATEEIRKFDMQTPIIALTAISLDENREMLLSYGMNEVITKPFDPEKFYEIIATTIISRNGN
ncbi:ATP-binding protein [Flavobacterium sp. WV_118_3]|uniref:tetratricopeptide repeat-containing hybrid sensor histidine kinase/response regulator n=1 Tax=Flavobacterium sp. WV_118_3 TaxID=3151764 RepID=UPI00321B3AE3